MMMQQSSGISNKATEAQRYSKRAIPVSSGELLEDLIIEQSVRRAKQAGWVVLPVDCYVHGVATPQALHTGQLHAWIVYMSVQPFCNPSLRQPLRLRCRVELLGDCLCVVGLEEPAERKPHLL